MKNITKRIITLLIAVIFVFCLVACNDSSTASIVTGNSSVTSTDITTSEDVVDSSDGTQSKGNISVSAQSKPAVNTSSQKPSTNSPLSNTSSEDSIFYKPSLEEEKIEVRTTGELVEAYSFENKFIMPKPQKKVFYDSLNDNVLPYCLFMPTNYDSSKEYPVILFLHGAGEIGTDNEKQLSHIDKMYQYNGDFASEAIVICPQSYEWWNLDRYYNGDRGGTLGSALHLLEKIMQTYSCDSNRIYVTGLSMGGYATWDLLEECGDIFAAGIPVCGGGNSDNGRAFKDIPIRIFHGTADPTVSFSSSQRMYNAIVNAGGRKVDFIELAGVGHNAWDYAYSDRDTFSWLFAQNKAHNPTCEYEYINCFKITDEKGNIIISDENIEETYFDFSFEQNKMINVEFFLDENGIKSFNQAYSQSSSKQFTLYWSAQKIYSFKLTKPLANDVFSVINVFDDVSFGSFYDTVNKVVNNI